MNLVESLERSAALRRRERFAPADGLLSLRSLIERISYLWRVNAAERIVIEFTERVIDGLLMRPGSDTISAEITAFLLLLWLSPPAMLRTLFY